MISCIAVLPALLLAVGAGMEGVVSGSGIATARLDVRAASDCTTQEDLAARVSARSPRIHFVDDATAVAAQASFTVARPGTVVGELILFAPAGKPSWRRFVARSCAEAADAVALIIAVTLDSTLVGESRTKMAGETISPESAPTLDSSASPSAVATVPISPAKPTTTEPQEPERLVRQASPAGRTSVVASSPVPTVAAQRRFGAHLAGQAIFGPAPAAMPGVAIYLTAALDRDALWSPAVVIGATHAWRNDLAEIGGTASFTLDMATLDACGLRVRLSVVEVRACAEASLGRLAASGDKTQRAASVSRVFGAAGAAAIVTAGLGSTVELWARLGSGMALLRDSYEFGPSIFYRVSRFTTSAALGVGVRW